MGEANEQTEHDLPLESVIDSEMQDQGAADSPLADINDDFPMHLDGTSRDDMPDSAMQDATDNLQQIAEIVHDDRGEDAAVHIDEFEGDVAIPSEDLEEDAAIDTDAEEGSPLRTTTEHVDYDLTIEMHGAHCDGSPGAQTPSEPSSRTATPCLGAEDGDDEVDLSAPAATEQSKIPTMSSSMPVSQKVEIPKAIREHTYLHKKAVALKPTTYLPAHRYWIGVLNPTTTPKDARNQKDFIWFRGHGGITFRTIRWIYIERTALPGDVKLMIQGQTPEDTDLMRELDYHNDKHVIFRAQTVIELD